MTDRPTATHRRIAVVTPTSRVDLSVPVGLTAAELLPVVLDLGRVQGDNPHGWSLGRVGRGLIDPEQSLAAAGVRDGDLLDLRCGPGAGIQPVHEDIADAVAAVAAETVDDTMTVGRRVLVGLAVVLAVGTVAAAWRGGPSWVNSLVAVALAAAATGSTRRPGTWTPPVLGLAGIGVAAAVAHAAVGGWFAPSLTVAAGAALAATVMRPGRTVFVAVTVCGSTAAAGALALQLFPAGGTAVSAAIAVTGLTVIPAAPGLGTRWCGLHRRSDLIVSTSDTWQQATSLARRGVQTVTGLLTGLAVTVAVAAAVLARAGGVAAVLSTVVLVVLALRSRSVAVRGQVAALLLPAAVALVALATPAVIAASDLPVGDTGMTALVASLAVGVATLATTGRRPRWSPSAVRLMRGLECALIVSVVPLALVVVDGYRLIRHL